MYVDGVKTAICSYIPGLTDHRGVSLYIYAKQNNLELKDFDLGEEKDLLTKLFNYMNNPYHIKERITQRFKPRKNEQTQS